MTSLMMTKRNSSSKSRRQKRISTILTFTDATTGAMRYEFGSEL